MRYLYKEEAVLLIYDPKAHLSLIWEYIRIAMEMRANKYLPPSMEISIIEELKYWQATKGRWVLHPSGKYLHTSHTGCGCV